MVIAHENWMLALAALMASGYATPLTPWQKIDHPLAGAPQAVGSFANGCIIDAQPLPLNSADYQVMRIDPAPLFWLSRSAGIYSAPQPQSSRESVEYVVDRRYGDASRRAFQQRPCQPSVGA